MATRKPATRPLIEVHLDAPELGPCTHIGNLFPGEQRVDLPPSFEYTAQWLGSKTAVSIDPQLDLVAGEQHSREGRGFGVFADCAPDRWGRVLMERREVQAAAHQNRPRARMNDLFFMLGVNDFTRSGALRFRVPPDEVFVDNSPLPAPPVTDLRELAAVARQLDGPRPEDMPQYERWLSLLVAPAHRWAVRAPRPRTPARMVRCGWPSSPAMATPTTGAAGNTWRTGSRALRASTCLMPIACHWVTATGRTP
ncbi:MAG: HipA N-terminal domain-containing protein [Burkholderiales bacterium]|nr:HipA N-terminal domain-containing protein [Burkholderiales bacterium]